MAIKQKSCTFAVSCLILMGMAFFCRPAQAQDALWRTYFNSAEKAYQHGEYTECETLLNSAVGASRKYDDSLIAYYYLARVCERLNNPTAAERNYRVVLDNLGPKIWATLRPPDGALDWDQIQSIETEHTLSSSDFLKRFRHQKGPLQSRLAKPITTVDVLTDLGLLMQEQSRNQEAEQMFRQALMLSELRSETAAAAQPRILQRLAKLYASENRKMESDALYKQLEELRVKSMPGFEQLVDKNVKDINRLGKNRVLTATRLNNLALFCSTHGDYPRASELYGRALENCDKDSNKADMMIIMRNYADLLEAMGKNEEAKRFLTLAGGIGDFNDVRSVAHKNVLMTSSDSSVNAPKPDGK
ncbi:MAG: tetratricopeptide repeat protein [Cyanobacteria bacterium SZAS-4]|nr:tetratricopeptide repeat protein [Cyanobacteria bacterium SZAS-4]